METQRVLMGY